MILRMDKYKLTALEATSLHTVLSFFFQSIKNSPVADFQGTQNLNSLKFMPSKRGPRPMVSNPLIIVVTIL